MSSQVKSSIVSYRNSRRRREASIYVHCPQTPQSTSLYKAYLNTITNQF